MLWNGAITSGICGQRNGFQGAVRTAAILSCSCPLWVTDIEMSQRNVRFAHESGHGWPLKQNQRRSLSGKVLTCSDQFGTVTVGIRHFDHAAEIILSFASIADAERGLRRPVVAAQPLRIVD